MNETSHGVRYTADPPPRKVNTRRPAERAAAETIREARQARGRSLEALAGCVGRGPSHLSSIETGRNTPSAALVEALARELELDPAPLLCAWRLVPERAAEVFFDTVLMRRALAMASLVRTCPGCHGSGLFDEKNLRNVRCENCDGSGSVFACCGEPAVRCGCEPTAEAFAQAEWFDSRAAGGSQ